MSNSSRFPIWLTWLLVTSGGIFVTLCSLTGFSPFLLSLGVALMAISQWAILRPRVRGAAAWIPIAAILYFLSAAAVNALAGLADRGSEGAPLIPGPAPYLVIGLAFGSLIGLAQCLWLRRRVKAAGWWILASAVAWGLACGWLFAKLAGFAENPPEGIGQGVIAFAVSLVPALVMLGLPTGIAAHFLLAEDNIRSEYRVTKSVERATQERS